MVFKLAKQWRAMALNLAVGSLCALWLTGASAADYYVNNLKGADTNSGQSAEAAFATLAKAAGLAGAGDRIIIANTGEPYHECLPLRKSGTAQAPLVIEGNGAVLTGLRPMPADKWQKQADGRWFFALPKQSHMHRFIYDLSGKAFVAGKAADQLAAEEYFCDATGLFFRPVEGKTIADYQLQTMFLTSGVEILDVSYIICSNLTCEYFANDGFNMHGDVRGLVFRNIVSRYNGDDGFSIHEDGGVHVYGGYFHHNEYGIQDIQTARSWYSGILSEDNRDLGINLIGGNHSLEDSVVRNNRNGQIVLGSMTIKDNPERAADRFNQGVYFIKNVVAEGGPVALTLSGHNQASVIHSVFRGADCGISVNQNAYLHLTQCLVADNHKYEMVWPSGGLYADGNIYSPGRFKLGEKEFTPAQWTEYCQASNLDKTSAVADKLAAAENYAALIQLPIPGQPKLKVGPTKSFVAPEKK